MQNSLLAILLLFWQTVFSFRAFFGCVRCVRAQLKLAFVK